MDQTRAPAPAPDSSRLVPHGSEEQGAPAAAGIMCDDVLRKGGGGPAAGGRQSSQSQSSDNNEGGAEGEEENFYWRFTDVGQVGERSRDGSIHATDEVFNSVSHLSAFFVSVLGTVLLITKSAAQHAPWKIVSFSIYGSSLCFLFAASTLHHAVTTTPKLELFFQTLDYLAIFPLIAGTFTPLCLVFLHSSVIGWSFFSVVWTLAIISMCIVAHLFEKTPKWMTTTAYVSLGWIGAILGLYLYPSYLDARGMALLILGGVIYSVGGVVFITEKPNPIPSVFGFHELWHCAVIAAAFVHYLLMYFYVLPYPQPTLYDN
mmetsp:Transcript_54072/g.131255  ORF Transcript_54072/g.131255 Transcript_54072/m.131255 type:complete len:317 (+) Transcript_54072:179-1129(+)